MNQEEEIWTPRDISKRYKTSRPWPYQAARRGYFPYHKLGDKLIRFKARDVISFFEQCRVEKNKGH